MKLYGTIIKNSKIIKEATVEKNDDKASFRDLLEQCLVDLCRELDVQVPLWLAKNTKEFVSFRRTFFTEEQFLEKVKFDRFEVKME